MMTIEDTIDNIVERATTMFNLCYNPNSISNGAVRRKTLDLVVKHLQTANELCDIHSINFPEDAIDLIVQLDEIYSANILLINV